MLDTSLITCPILRAILTEAKRHLAIHAPTGLADSLALIHLCAPGSYAEHVDRGIAFLDWAIRAALPSALVGDLEILRPVAGDIREAPPVSEEGAPLVIDAMVTMGAVIVREQPGWRHYVRLRAADEMLGAAGDALASLIEVQRIDVPSLRTRGREESKAERRAEVKVELDHAVTCATQLLIAAGTTNVFLSMAIAIGEIAGEPLPEHGAWLGYGNGQTPIAEEYRRLVTRPRWCGGCRMIVGVEQDRPRCPKCLSPWVAPPPQLVGEERCPIAIGM
jgi:hypothetical protein